jgi:hypothetical protein
VGTHVQSILSARWWKDTPRPLARRGEHSCCLWNQSLVLEPQLFAFLQAAVRVPALSAGAEGVSNSAEGVSNIAEGKHADHWSMCQLELP